MRLPRYFNRSAFFFLLFSCLPQPRFPTQPVEVRVRKSASGPQAAAWLGGSLLASSPSFSSDSAVWSLEQYREWGPALCREPAVTLPSSAA